MGIIQYILRLATLFQVRAVGIGLNIRGPGGQVVVIWWAQSTPPVELGLTDLTKYRGAMASGPTAPTALHVDENIK